MIRGYYNRGQWRGVISNCSLLLVYKESLIMLYLLGLRRLETSGYEQQDTEC